MHLGLALESLTTRWRWAPLERFEMLKRERGRPSGLKQKLYAQRLRKPRELGEAFPLSAGLLEIWWRQRAKQLLLPPRPGTKNATK